MFALAHADQRAENEALKTLTTDSTPVGTEERGYQSLILVHGACNFEANSTFEFLLSVIDVRCNRHDRMQ